jgi:hypothetical protein
MTTLWQPYDNLFNEVVISRTIDIYSLIVLYDNYDNLLYIIIYRKKYIYKNKIYKGNPLNRLSLS